MAHRLEIGLKRGVPDARGRAAAASARRAGVPVRGIATRTVYLLEARLSAADRAAARAAFADPVIERAAFGRLAPPRFDWLIEAGFKPGVTDNLGRTARVALADALDRPLAPDEAVYTAIQYFLRGAAKVRDGGLTRPQVERLAQEQLANPLIHTLRVWSAEEWRQAPVDDRAPAVRGESDAAVECIDVSGPEEALLRLNRERIWSLNRAELRAVRDYFARPAVRTARTALGLPDAPTDVELECLAQTWSEHCSHKVFAARIRYVDERGREERIESLFKTYIQGATRALAPRLDWLVSVFSDNAGVIRFDDRVHLVYKVETHNSPSALDPYGGAMTGIVGVNRDPMGTGMGARLLCNVWGYCLGSPFYDGPLPEGLMHPRRIRDGVHEGVIEGGNQSGIPWARGFEMFDERFLGKPLVFCGTVGVLPVEVGGRPSERKEVRPGDAIVMAGGRIGKDGIHGATFSSEPLRAESPLQAVQIGDPITQRKLYEFLIEARDQGLYRALTDNGAGGLSCSVGEMGRLAGGAELDLARAPLKYPGLLPWEILLSEAQERMTFAVPPESLPAFLDLARRRDVEAAVLGTFTDSGALVVRHAGRVVGRLDMSFLYEGCPVLSLEARWTPPEIPAPRPLTPGSRNTALRALLAGLDLCSREAKSRQYDGEVKGLSVVKPFVGVFQDVPADATVMRVAYDRPAGIVLAEGINPFYADLDPYAMMGAVIDEAVRRIVSAGGRLDRIAGLDNFCWPDPVASPEAPDGAFKLAQLVRANKALYDVATAFGVPCISGKDSVKNDSTRGGRRISIPPTVLFSTLGRIDEVRKTVTMDLKADGDLVYAVGWTRPELGASAYHRWLAARQGSPDRVGGAVPGLDPEQALALYRAMNRAADAGLLRSSHTPTRGGLAVALALTALGGNLGLEADLDRVPADPDTDNDALLFSESNSRFVVSVAPGDAAAFERLFAGLPCARIGRVRAAPWLRLAGRRGRVLVSIGLAVLRRAFKRTLAECAP